MAVHTGHRLYLKYKMYQNFFYHFVSCHILVFLSKFTGVNIVRLRISCRFHNFDRLALIACSAFSFAYSIIAYTTNLINRFWINKFIWTKQQNFDFPFLYFIYQNTATVRAFLFSILALIFGTWLEHLLISILLYSHWKSITHRHLQGLN